jgi:hypothetical protein
MTSLMRNETRGKTLRILWTVVLMVVIFLAMVWLRAFCGSMKGTIKQAGYLVLVRYITQDPMLLLTARRMRFFAETICSA